jgi:hypothetical protein
VKRGTHVVCLDRTSAIAGSIRISNGLLVLAGYPILAMSRVRVFGFFLV